MTHRIKKSDYIAGGSTISNHISKDDDIQKIATRLRKVRKRIESSEGVNKILLEKDYYSIQNDKYKIKGYNLIRKIYDLKRKNKDTEMDEKDFFDIKIKDLMENK